MVVFSNVKAAEIEITCGSTECISSDFMLIRLNESNTSGVGSAYSEYGEYFQSYYQSTQSCVNDKTGCSHINSTYPFTMNWSPSGVFSATSTKGFDNLTQAIGTSASYIKAGTYAYVVKQTAIFSGAEQDKSEYIVYVNVTSDLEVGSIAARRIKNSSGTKILAEKVTELSFGLSSIYPTTIYNQSADFYISNTYNGTYADLTAVATYNVSVMNSDGSAVVATVYDENGCVKVDSVCKTYTFENWESQSIPLISEQALVFSTGSLAVEDVVTGYIEGIASGGQTYSTTGYVPSLTIAINGKTSTLSPVQWEKDSEGMNVDSFYNTLGGSDVNYAQFVWDYSEDNVPDTGIITRILSFFIVTVLVLAIVLLIVLTKKRTKNS